MIEESGSSQPPVPSPEGKQQELGERIRIFGFEIRVGRFGRKLLWLGRKLRSLGYKLLSDRTIKQINQTKLSVPTQKQPLTPQSLNIPKRSKLPVTGPSFETRLSNGQKGKEQLIQESKDQAKAAMKKLVNALLEEKTSDVVYALYALKQGVAKEASAKGQGVFGGDDLFMSAQLAADDLELDNNTKKRLKSKRNYTIKLIKAMRTLENKTVSGGEDVSSLLAQSASACILGSQAAISAVAERFFPGETDLLREVDQLPLDSVDQEQVQACFDALYQCRTKTEDEINCYLECLVRQDYQEIPTRLGELIRASLEDCIELGMPGDSEYLLARIKKTAQTMNVPDRTTENIRRACHKPGSPLLGFMAASNQLGLQAKADPMVAFQAKVMIAINDALCEAVDVGGIEDEEANTLFDNWMANRGAFSEISDKLNEPKTVPSRSATVVKATETVPDPILVEQLAKVHTQRLPPGWVPGKG